MESRSGSKPTLYMKRDRYPEDEGLAIWQKKKNHVFIESQKGEKKKTTAGRILLRGPSSSQQQIIWCRSFPVVRML